MEHIANFAEKLNVLKQDLKHYGQFIKEYRTALKLNSVDWAVGKYVNTHTKNHKEKWNSIWTPESLCTFPTVWTPNKGMYPYAYRHLHIAYSLLRGNTMEEIESKVREGNEPDLKLVERYIEHYMGIPNFFKNLMDFRRKKPKVIKMYVLVREDMAPINRTVQAGHAVAEYLQTHKAVARQSSEHADEPWRNGYMIYLGVNSEAELNKWETKLKASEKTFATFVEPDWGTPTKTALACVDFGEIFEGLPLLSLEGNKRESTPDVVVTDETVVR